jgi:hypothetical protein
MGKVLAFRRTEETCENCWYYIVRRESHRESDQPQGNYCGHPDRVKGCYLYRLRIGRLGLQRDSGQWCPKYVHMDSTVMKKLQVVANIRFALFDLQRGSGSSPSGKADTASLEYRELVDQFYQENRKIMTINQYKAARRKSEYFVDLIDEAFEYYKRKSKEQRHKDPDH